MLPYPYTEFGAWIEAVRVNGFDMSNDTAQLLAIAMLAYDSGVLPHQYSRYGHDGINHFWGLPAPDPITETDPVKSALLQSRRSRWFRLLITPIKPDPVLFEVSDRGIMKATPNDEYLGGSTYCPLAA